MEMVQFRLFCIAFLCLQFALGEFRLRSTRTCYSKHSCEDCKKLSVYAACRRFCRTFCAQWYIPAKEIPFVNNNLVAKNVAEGSNVVPDSLPEPPPRVASPPRVLAPPPEVRIPIPPRPTEFPVTEPVYYDGTTEPLYYDETVEPYYEDITQAPVVQTYSVTQAARTAAVWNPFEVINRQVLERIVPEPVDVVKKPRIQIAQPSRPVVPAGENVFLSASLGPQALAQAALAAAQAAPSNNSGIQQLAQAALELTSKKQPDSGASAIFRQAIASPRKESEFDLSKFSRRPTRPRSTKIRPTRPRPSLPRATTTRRTTQAPRTTKPKDLKKEIQLKLRLAEAQLKLAEHAAKLKAAAAKPKVK